jgi:hypothetical protein
MLGASVTDDRVFEIDECTGRSFTDGQLKGLSLLKHLHKLSIPGSSISDAGIAGLGEQAELSWLALDSTKVTDKSVTYIAKMHALRYLRLSNSQITDLGVAAITKLPHLEILCLDGTSITDQVADSVIAMKRLKFLKVDRTAVTLAGANAVWLASPKLSIYPYNHKRAPRLRGRNGDGSSSSGLSLNAPVRCEGASRGPNFQPALPGTSDADRGKNRHPPAIRRAAPPIRSCPCIVPPRRVFRLW